MADPAIKLFGKTIPLPEPPPIPAAGPSLEASSCSTTANTNSNINVENKNVVDYCSDDMDHDEGVSNHDGEEEDGGDDNDKEIKGEVLPVAKIETVSSEEPRNSDAASGISDNPKTSSVEENTATQKSSKTEDEQSEASNSQDKTLKKPDKIIPCPRCNSMDTKFCYYNNYNVNQPRHFCKNCQRYWTAGGTMRNVPVGAGRRKNKNSVSQYRHITVPEGLHNARPDVPTAVHAHHSTLKSNGTVLTFGSDTPLCESMASVLNLADKTIRTPNGFHKPEELRIPLPYSGGVENGDTSVNGSSSVTSSNSKDEASPNVSQEQVIQNCPTPTFPPQISCYPGAPWPFSWNSAQWTPPVPMPAFCPPGFPMPFYPAAAYWGCSVPGTWNVPWLPQPSSPNLGGPSSGPNSPTLGKHSRDENMLKSSSSAEEEPPKQSSSERSLWIPKTLRIDDPGEAARSSIWATLGIKNDKADSISGGGLFKSFQQKNDERNPIAETSKLLQANPAALSRSVSFQERS